MKTLKRAIVAALSMLAAYCAAPAPAFAMTQEGIAPELHPEVVQVVCDEGEGTAFSVGPHEMVSVNHVTSLTNCKIGGQPFTVLFHRGDLSILSVPSEAKTWLSVDCKGYVPGHHYTAFGYAQGLPTLTSVDINGTDMKDHGESILLGVFTVIPGQSGGPIIDAGTGSVVGTVNTYDMEGGASGSVELKGTALCPLPSSN